MLSRPLKETNRQDSLHLGQNVRAPPAEGVAADMVDILFSDIWLFFETFASRLSYYNFHGGFVPRDFAVLP